MSDSQQSGALVTTDQPPDFSRDDLALLDDVSAAFETSPAGMPLPAIEAELDRIAKYRKADRAAYAKDEETQRRERELLALKEVDFLDLDPELLREWEDSGGIALRLKITREAVAVAMENLSYPDQQDLSQGFDQLPRNVQTTIYKWISLDPGGGVRPATPATLESFKKSDVGAAMAREWGDNAARKLGRVRATVAMMSASVSASDDQAARDWFDTLPASQQKACLRALAR